MNIDQFIQKIEDEYLEEDLESLTAEKRIVLYLSALEFWRAKLVRSNAMPSPEGEDDKKILIKIADGNNRDTDIQQDIQQE